jgi:hypothetical protein
MFIIPYLTSSGFAMSVGSTRPGRVQDALCAVSEEDRMAGRYSPCLIALTSTMAKPGQHGKARPRNCRRSSASPRRGTGHDGNFAPREEVASAAAPGLSAGALEAATTQQGQLWDEPQPCPHCGKLCPGGTAERPLRAKGALVPLREPKGYCPAWRRVFSLRVASDRGG